MQTQIRERTVNPYFVDLTDLLGSQLIAPGFRLYLNQYGQHLVFGGKDLRRFSVDAYTLKVIRRYCRLYLQSQATKHQRQAKARSGTTTQ